MNTLTDHELHELVMMLQSTSPLGRLSNMEARTVIELMQQRGYKITKPAAPMTEPVRYSERSRSAASPRLRRWWTMPLAPRDRSPLNGLAKPFWRAYVRMASIRLAT